MRFSTDKDITAEGARFLRGRAGLGQRKFWASVGVSQPAGVQYEKGRRIPKPVRTLLFSIYVAGLPLDTGSIEGARQVRAIAAKR